MKNVFLVLAVLASTFISNQAHAQDQREAQIKFASEVIDYGEIKANSNGTRTFEFTNTGNAPLIISNVMSSCGCLVATWSQEPVAPGAKGRISVKYDTNRVGQFTKSVTVNSNAVNQPQVYLRIKGKVLPAEEVPVSR